MLYPWWHTFRAEYGDPHLVIDCIVAVADSKLKHSIAFLITSGDDSNDIQVLFQCHLSANHRLNLGVFGACIECRLSGEAQFPAALQDGKCAVRWVRSVASKYSMDPSRIGVCGGSAGGHLSSMMAVSNGVNERVSTDIVLFAVKQLVSGFE